MKFMNYRRPHRAMICCKAKMQMLQALNDCSEWLEPDDILLKELATTLSYSSHYRTLYEHCQSQQDIASTNEMLVSELVQTYQQVSQRKLDPVVQNLNALL